ncbi:MAG: 3-dehydroquinate synthase [Chloroflexi bacterium]|nr:3-dehydroquinate synthase [Chloroflexota bacterium]
MTTGQISRVFLTGLSGSGKSTVARLVAEALDWQAVDTDALIEEAEGRSIAEIFASDGEEQFRALERKEITGAAALDNVVVATGGGAILDIDNRRAMADGGLVVCLQAQPETLVQQQRVRDTGPASDGRPLLAGGNPEERLAQMQAERQRYYALADAHIDTGQRTPSQVADAVVAAVREGDLWFVDHPDRLLLPEERDRFTEAKPVWVEASSRRYPAYVEWGLLDRMGELLHEAGLEGTAYVISDGEVLPCHGDRVLHSLRAAGFETAAFAIPAGEEHKTLATAATVYDWLVAHRAERGTTLIALGGGGVGDLVGFVAATFLRGVPLVQAPTSMLAMVDASIGGKVAVDHKEGKNLIGAFYQPRLVVADVSTLKTLPQRLLAEGCAEAIKHALILDPKLLDDLETRADDLLHVEPALAVDIVRRNVAIKAAVVADDERDTGRRAILNYGHTIGHAIEAAAGYRIGHGAADAIGMTAAAEIGRRMGVTPEALVDRQQAVLERFGLPTKGPKLDVESVLAAMTLDKKVSAGVVNWVLLEEAGRAVVRSDVPETLVREVVSEVLS